MAKKNRYAVHPDFAHYPSFPFPFNKWVLGVLNPFLHADTFFRQRHIKNKATLHLVPSSDGSVFNVFQFDPDGVSTDEKLPAIVYYHGGAFVLTYASTHVEAVAYYANEAKCRVFLVDYRLAPKYLAPKAFEDCYAAFEWLGRNADALNIDANKIVAMGDSAGGCFSAAIAQKAKDENKQLAAQVLIYPALDASCSTRSATMYVDAPMFSGKANKDMWEMYLKGYSGKEVPPYIVPANRKDLSGLSPAYVETAEFDPLCDEGAEYAKRLEEAGVTVTLHQPKGTVHGYDTVPASEITQDALKRRIAFLKEIFTHE